MVPTSLVGHLQNRVALLCWFPGDRQNSVDFSFHIHFWHSGVTQGQMDGFSSQLQCKCHPKELAIFEDGLEICPRLDTRVRISASNFANLPVVQEACGKDAEIYIPGAVRGHVGGALPSSRPLARSPCSIPWLLSLQLRRGEFRPPSLADPRPSRQRVDSGDNFGCEWRVFARWGEGEFQRRIVWDESEGAETGTGPRRGRVQGHGTVLLTTQREPPRAFARSTVNGSNTACRRAGCVHTSYSSRHAGVCRKRGEAAHRRPRDGQVPPGLNARGWSSRVGHPIEIGWGLSPLYTVAPLPCVGARGAAKSSSSASLGFTDYSHVEMLGVRYESVNFGAEKSLGPPIW